MEEIETDLLREKSGNNQNNKHGVYFIRTSNTLSSTVSMEETNGGGEGTPGRENIGQTRARALLQPQAVVSTGLALARC